jgi:hypothetical protein
MEQFKLFNADKKYVIALLNGLKRLVQELGHIGLNITEDTKKIDQAIKYIENDVLRIALFGAFDDGKTSVIAGWLGHIVSGMKIETDESSDRLAVYRPDNLPYKCEIVDTPGLFGNKEYNDENDNPIPYGDITRKFISEAHLIFYVVDATNPLKESHKSTVKWVLRDLNKLSSTIFIINKMDEVADLRDLEDFGNQAKIKRENLLGKLLRFVDLSEEEKNKVNIVCISSNPNNRGLDFWLKKRDVYEERSRIKNLKQITNTILDRTARDVLIKKTGYDVIKDVVSHKILIAENEYAELDLYTQNMTSEIQRIDEDISTGKSGIVSSKEDLFNELNDLEKRLLGRIRSLSQNDIIEFLEDEIGYSNDDIGYKLRLKIEQSCEKCFRQSNNIMKGIEASIERQLDSSESFINSISSSALNVSRKAMGALSKMPVSTIKAAVFAARNAIKTITGTVIKFKPWEATKIATKISKWAGPIGAGIQVLADFIEMAQKKKIEKQLITTQTDIANMVKDHFKVIYDILSDNTKVFENFAPQIVEFEGILKQQKERLAEIQKKKALLVSIKDKFMRSYLSKNAFDAEYKVL